MNKNKLRELKKEFQNDFDIMDSEGLDYDGRRFFLEDFIKLIDCLLEDENKKTKYEDDDCKIENEYCSKCGHRISSNYQRKDGEVKYEKVDIEPFTFENDEHETN